MPVYDFFCRQCDATVETFHPTISSYEKASKPECPNGHGAMERDLSKREEGVMAGYLQEKGKWPWYDIQTDTTYHSRKEWKQDLERRGIHPLGKETLSDRNREFFRHRKVY